MSSILSSLGSFAKSAGGGSVIGSAIGAGTSILSSILGNNSQKKQMEYAADIARKQGDYDREQNYLYQKKQLDDERAYNDPSAQMARYMNAGLNPNLIYGQVNPNAPSIASSLGVSSGVGSPSPSFNPDIAGGAAQGALLAAQVRNLNADSKDKESKAGLTAEQTSQLKMMNEITARTKDSTTERALSENYRSIWENNSYATTWKQIFENPDANQRLYDSMIATVSEPIQRLANMKQEGRNLNEQEILIYNQAKAVAEQIALGYAGLQNGVSIAKINAGVSKYAADKSYDAAIANVDKTFSGFLADILNAAGIKDALIEKIQDLLKSNGGNVVDAITKAAETSNNRMSTKR